MAGRRASRSKGHKRTRTGESYTVLEFIDKRELIAAQAENAVSSATKTGPLATAASEPGASAFTAPLPLRLVSLLTSQVTPSKIDPAEVDSEHATHEQCSPVGSQLRSSASLAEHDFVPVPDLEALAHSQSITRPLSDPQSFRLMKYYAQVIAPWLDLSDAERLFTRQVPQEAFHFPPLLFAILTFSAYQLRDQDVANPEVAEVYYNKCVASLIPILESEDLAVDGRVLAATVILRMYEMQCNASAADPQQHLSGSWSLLQIPRRDTFDKLRVAAFWIYLRQDIQMAERYHRRTIIDLDNSQFQCAFETFPAEDHTWANRMVWAYGHVINYCFSPELRQSRERWEFLHKKIREWEKHRPASFEPMYYEATPSDSSVFPAIWLLNDWHVLGKQTFYMALLLLELYTPEQHLHGLERLQEQRRQEINMQYHARTICGIATTNSCPAARIHVCEHVKICRQVLKLPEEQTQILRIQESVENETGWITST